MSVSVGVERLRERIAEYGERAYLVTVGDDGAPHVVSVVVRVEGQRLVVGAGRRTAANAATHPGVTLLWPPAEDVAYSLIVDGPATVSGDDDEPLLTIEPTGAVLHRVAGVDGDGPGCVPVLGG